MVQTVSSGESSFSLHVVKTTHSDAVEMTSLQTWHANAYVSYYWTKSFTAALLPAETLCDVMKGTGL